VLDVLGVGGWTWLPGPGRVGRDILQG